MEPNPLLMTEEYKNETGSKASQMVMFGDKCFEFQELIKLFEEREWTINEMSCFLNQSSSVISKSHFICDPIFVNLLENQDFESTLKDKLDKTKYKGLLMFFPVRINNSWVVYRYYKNDGFIKVYYQKTSNKEENMKLKESVLFFGTKICNIINIKPSISENAFDSRLFKLSTLIVIFFCLKPSKEFKSKVSDPNDIAEFKQCFYIDILPAVLFSCKPIINSF